MSGKVTISLFVSVCLMGTAAQAAINRGGATASGDPHVNNTPTGISRSAMSTAASRNAMLAAKSGIIPGDQLSTELTSLCEADGKMVGAGGGKVVVMNDAGSIEKTIPAPIANATVARYNPGSVLVGDRGKNTIYSLNIASGRPSKLFALGEIKLGSGGMAYAEAFLKNSPLASIAFDGKFVYAAVEAGFSSSVFKIDPATKTAVGHAFVGGDDPAAMVYQDNGLMVLHSKRQQIRRLDSSLRMTPKVVNVPVRDGKGLIIRGNEVRVVSKADKGISRMQADMSSVISATALQPKVIVNAGKIIEIINAPRKYAVLICGDIAENFWGECFWNDTVWMYKTLIAAGYSKENIYVLYGAGSDYISANANYRYPETVTDFPATVGWVNAVFDGLKNGDAAHGIAKMKANDTLFVWTFDHGGGSGGNSYLCLWGGSISDTNFANKLNAVPYEKRAIFMQQCRSGGFIDNLRNSKTFISTACTADQNAQPADTENENIGGVWYSHGEYNYYVTSALAGLTATGSGVNADSNSNGKTSAKECHLWESGHESRGEVPQMADDGACGDSFCTRD